MLQPKKRILSATLLIMGSMIGTGMVGMPSAQGGSGLFPSFAMLIFCWFYTFCCSRLLLEACSWLPRGSNFMSIVSHFLGKRSAIFCWCFYAIYFYCAVTTHIAGAGTVVGGFFQHGLSDTIGSVVFTAFFAGFVYNSLQASDRLNRLLMFGLTLTCFLFIPVISPHINFTYLKETHWARIIPAMQVFLYAFSFQYIIPSLYNYLECDTRAMKKALWIGSLSTLVLYMAWTFLVLGVVPPSELKEALATGQSSIVPIEKHLRIPLLSGLVREFIILAISTSFLAVTITFFDFWADTLKWGKRGLHGLFLLLLVFVLPLILALNSSAFFVSILDVGGIFGGTLVFGVFPVLFVWIGRYRKYSKVAPELLPGGKAVLILTLLVSIATLLVAVVF